MIDAVGAAGSFLDGGPSLPTQRSCVPLLNPKDATWSSLGVQRTELLVVFLILLFAWLFACLDAWLFGWRLRCLVGCLFGCGGSDLQHRK